MPILTCDGVQKNASAGCAVVAMAQILAYVSPAMTVKKDDNSNLTINWSLLKESYEIWEGDNPVKDEMVAYLFKDVFSGANTTPECNGSSTSADDTRNYLKRHIEINSSQTFDVQGCKNSLDNFRVSYGAGARDNGGIKVAHAWVVDGYAIARKGTVNGDNGTNDLVNRYDMYLHCNMGYGTYNQSGWFLVGNDWSISFELYPGTNSRNYNTNLRTMLDARPK